MKKLRVFLSCLCAILPLSNAIAQNQYFLSPQFGFGNNFDGSIRPGDTPYVTTTSYQRGLSYNPVTGNLIFIDRQAGGGGSAAISGFIYVLDSVTGAALLTLNTNGMGGGDFADFAVGVADDGAVYVGNVVNNGTSSAFKLYRWATDSSVDPPTVAFSGDPGSGKPQRWGDTLDIRGGGASTQILLGTRNQGSVLGTNVAVLTTADGVHFTATTLATDVSGDNPTGGGVAFGAGNTFWAKNIDTPLRLFSFDLGTGRATTLHSYGTNVLAISRNLEAMTLDLAHNLMAIVDFPSGLDHVRLYDVSDLNNPPVLMDIQAFPVDNANGTTTKGYLDFGAGVWFVHDMNNGLMSFLTDVAANPPTIAAQPKSPGRVLSGRTVTFEVLAYPRVTYQWQHNTVDIPSATNAVFTIPNVQVADAGGYRVIVRNAFGNQTSDEVSLGVINTADLFHLSALWSAAPGVQPYVTSTGGANTPNERSLAYNALSNQVLVVQRSGNNYTVHVIDAATGTKLYNLKTNGILPVVASEVSGANGIGLLAITVADDGAVYACNESPNAGGGASFATNKLFRVYRWANTDSNTLPIEIFEGDPAAQSSNFRWGDVLTARGSGLNTQLLLDNQSSAARYMAVLSPSDGFMTNFPTQYFFQDVGTPFGGTIGRSIQFGTGNTFWQKRRAAALINSSFDLSAVFPNNISPVVALYTNFPSTVGQVGLDFSRSLALGINYQTAASTSDTLDLYDFSDPNFPVLLAQYNFPFVHPLNANANFIGQIVLSGDKVFALDGNSGIVAFKIVAGAQTLPTISDQPQNLRIVSGNNGTLRVLSADLATFQWQFNNSNLPGATSSTYTIANASTNDAGPYRVIVSNDAGSVTSAVAVVTIIPADNFPRLTSCWSLAPLSRSYLPRDTDAQGRTPLYRGIAYNALSNQVYVISRTAQTAGLTVNVLDATTGADLYQLNTSGIGAGTIILLAMDVTSDGVLYAADMTDANTGQPYNLYRWANSDPAAAPTMVYSGDPGASLAASLRWGDTLNVRGTGANTEIIIDANTGTHAAILTPTDASQSSFLANPFAQTYGGGSIGRSLKFASGNNFWQKRSGARLQLSQYDLPNQTSAAVTNYPNFPPSLGPVDLDLTHSILAGLNFSSTTNAPDTLDLYDISDLNNPLRIAAYSFPENSRPNGNLIGQVLFAGNKVYAVDGNNGIVAFNVVPPVAPRLTITHAGANVTLAWPASATGYVLQKNSNPMPPGWIDVSQQPTVVNGQNTISESSSTGKAFYRLHKP